MPRSLGGCGQPDCVVPLCRVHHRLYDRGRPDPRRRRVVGRQRGARDGAAQSTARAWLNGTRAPTGERAERLIELSALVERLDRLMEPDYIAIWLRKPVPALDDEKPLDVLGRGDYMRVARLVSELESPTAV